MLKATNNDYQKMFGNIENNATTKSGRCMGSCTGCMCSCRCSCSYVDNDGFEWEMKLSANSSDYSQLLGNIDEDFYANSTGCRCACVACNTCTCACSCRAVPEYEEIAW